MTEEDIIKRRKRTERQRSIGVYLSKILSGKRNADIGVVFGISVQVVTNGVRGVERRREGDKRFNSELTRVKAIMGSPK